MFCSETDYDSIDHVFEEHPSAAAIVPVEGGWRVFGTLSDLSTWEAQQ